MRFLSIITDLFKKKKTNPVVQDLLDNNHQFCSNCNDLFYTTNPKKKYCSYTCKNSFNNKKRKKP